MSTQKFRRLALKALKERYPNNEVECRHTSGHFAYYIDGHCVSTTGSSPKDIDNAIDNMLKDVRKAYRLNKEG